jgi:enediyne biosynthesis protein E4
MCEAARFHSGLAFASIVLTAGLARAGDIVPFTSEAGSRGLNFTMMPYPPISGYYGFGCGFADFDSDGDRDVIVVGAANGRVGLFENVGGTFIDRSLTSGIFPMTALSSFATADYDNDGDEDLLLTRVIEPSGLYRNDGNFTFTEVTFAAGIDTARLAKGACWGDYDGDGWIDLFICNYFYFFGPPGASENQLYRNNGDGTFEDVAPALSLNSDGASLEAVWTDYDRDGDLDLYVSNDRGPYAGFPANELYRNDGGTFTDVSQSSGADARLFSMGLACGDLDSNGRVDFFCTNTTDPAPPLFGAFPLLLGSPKGTFTQAQDLWGVAHPTTNWGWGSTFFDWNNDGRLDLYVHDQFSPNSLFQNNGRPPLVDVAAAAGIEGSNLASYCSAFGDVDGDGDIDVLMNNMGEAVTLFINKEGEKRNAVSFRVISTASRAAAVGANASLTVGKTTLYRESYAGGNSYLGQNELNLHFGLDAATTATSAVVRWPANGPTRTFSSIPANHTWTIYPPAKLGDGDQDGDIDAADRVALCDALGNVEPGTELFDFDGNFVVGSSDVMALKTLFLAAGLKWSDLNGDNHVDAADLAIILGAWGSTDCVKDLDGSGEVSATDLSILLGDWS